MNRFPLRIAAFRSACMAMPGLIALLLVVSTCQAQPLVTRAPQDHNSPVEFTWMAASDMTLDRLRGGFDLGSGLLVSFGISRSVSINGQMITATSFQLGDPTALTSQQAAALGQQLAAQTQVVRNGKGNSADLGASVPFATFIQNTVNNQTIRSHTVIEATSNAMGMVKGMNLQATISEAIAQAIGTR